MKKRLLSLLLCLVLVLMTTPFFVSAEPLFTEHLTAIEADSVFNTDGYASLKINEIYTDEDFELESMPKSALADKDGNMVFPYKETWLRYYYDTASGVVSLVDSDYNIQHYTYTKNESSDGSTVITDGGVGSVGGWGDDYISTPEQPAYYDMSGVVIKNSGFSGGTPMRNGYALVLENLPEDERYLYMHDDTFGTYEVWSTLKLIDKAGNTVYTFPESFGVPAGGKGDVFWGETVYLSSATPYSDERIGCCYRSPSDWSDSYCQYVDINGQTVLENVNTCFAFSEGLAVVGTSEGNTYGYIDKTGKIVIACRFDKADGFQNGYAGVGIDDKYGYIDQAGDVIIPLEYDNVYGAGDGFFSVVRNEKCGLVDVNNKVVIPFEYDDISSCENGVCYAIKDRKLVIFTLNNSQAAVGDASGDGVVNMKDVLAVRKFVAGIAVGGFNETAADVNKDGAVNMKDVLLVRKFIAGIIKELG